MKLSQTSLFVLSLIALATIFAGSLFVLSARASAPAGIPASVATTSPAIVGTTASTIFATSTCTARIISTQASPIMLTFGDNQGATPTGGYGNWQAASTTVAYDSGLYGCGAVKAYSYTASTLTLTETR